MPALAATLSLAHTAAASANLGDGDRPMLTDCCMWLPMLCGLQPYTVPRMQRLVAVALGMCNTVYITIIVCSSLVFGEALEADVLANVNSAAMAPLIGPAAAVAMAACVHVGYLLSIVGSYVLLCYPLRQVRKARGWSQCNA